MSTTPMPPKRRKTAGLRLPAEKVEDPQYSASARVFAIPELLEMILLEVPLILQLFELQRVNKTFRDTITGVKSLRRLMLLEHSPDRTEEYITKFLEQAQIAEATWPSSLEVFEWTNDPHPIELIVYLEDGSKPTDHQIRRAELLPYRQKNDSWRKILVCLPGQVWALHPEWQGCNIEPAEVRDATTLGDAVDEAEMRAKVVWTKKMIERYWHERSSPVI